MTQQGSSFFLPFYGRARCLGLVWEALGLPGGGDDELCLCHIVLGNYFWSLRLPEAFWGAFRVLAGTGGVLSFRCLPFGWKYSPILCQKVLERFKEEIGLVGVFVLIHIDDVLIVGREKARVREQARCAVEALCDAGGVISPKSTLEPVTRLVWLGKEVDVDVGEGNVRTVGNTWEALLAHWLHLSVGNCSMRCLQQFLGRAQWLCWPRFGHCPHLSGVWADVAPPPPPPLHLTPIKLLRFMCVVCVLALPGWSVVSLPRGLGREPVFVYVDAALDGGVYPLGLFLLRLGSRSTVPCE